MNNDYFDCIVFKKTKNGKTRAIRIGSAKKRDDGGFSVYLDANPLEGEFVIAPQRPKADAPPKVELDDEIPF